MLPIQKQPKRRQANITRTANRPPTDRQPPADRPPAGLGHISMALDIFFTNLLLPIYF